MHEGNVAPLSWGEVLAGLERCRGDYVRIRGEASTAPANHLVADGSGLTVNAGEPAIPRENLVYYLREMLKQSPVAATAESRASITTIRPICAVRDEDCYDGAWATLVIERPARRDYDSRPLGT